MFFAGIGCSSQRDALFIERLNHRETGSSGAPCNSQEAPLELLELTYEYYKQGAPPEHSVGMPGVTGDCTWNGLVG